ncbi:MAG TPA: amino acid adenylation domain-containing protein, partial [Kofleriaceae bacterium]|nr:amino acid adenylation domain-containing protein [Kofleriaceae bacterium]
PRHKQELLRRWLTGAQGLAPAITRRPPDTPAPLSFSQYRLWYLEQLVPGSATYNMPILTRLRGAWDAAAFATALTALAARHEVLRTHFALDGDAPIQIVDPPSPIAVPVIALGDVAAAEREGRALALAREEAARPFALDRGPLIRARAFQLEPDDHVLVLTMHHVAGDGWSMDVCFRELGALYREARTGTPAALPDLPLQYADYAVWQRKFLSGAELTRQLTFWREQLSGLAPALALPTDHVRPPVQRFRGGYLERLFGAATTAAARALAARHGATLFHVMLAAWTALLHRYTGQRDLAVGSPVANRPRPELESLIGFFANTLVFRIAVDGALSFDQLVERVRDRVVAASDHQDLPFEKLVEEVHPERDMSINPLFQTMLALGPSHAGTTGLVLDGVTADEVWLDRDTAMFDLWLGLSELGEVVHCGLEYNADLFERATALRLFDHFETLLGGAVAEPATPVGALPLLGPAEHAAIAGWNATARAYDLAPPLHGFIEAQVDRTPGATALRCEGAELSYAALDERANRLAHLLRAHGVGPDVAVAVCLERSLELSIALLAVLKAGGAYVPIDPGYPAERQRYLLDDAAAPLVIATRATRATHAAAAGAPAAILLDDPETAGALARQPASRPRVDLRPEHLAYIIYTSGSTGRPKGAMVPHRGIVNRLLWMQDALPIGPGDRVLHKTPFSFDVSVWELFWPLMAGAAMVIARPGGHRDPAYIAELCVRERVTTIHFVPTMLGAFLEAAPVEQLTSLRRIIASGEALPRTFAGAVLARMPGAAMVNLYGPTEASVDVTAWTCAPGDPDGGVPIGRPIANIAIHLLDRELRRVPVGVPGELYIAGVGLARGYLRRPALTAERFVPDPFAAEPGGRMYRTGDLARYRPDGAIEFLGRTDDQVKVRGFRLELGEVEAALRRDPAVHDAVVTVSPDGQRLAAYVVPVPEPPEDRRRAEEDRVEYWGSVFEQGYSREGAAAPENNFATLISSFTREPLPASEMRELWDGTLARLRRLPRRRVLEIGCGVGLLLSQLAPGSERYVATELSPWALDGLRAWCAEHPDAPVELHRRPAHALPPGLADLDLVILHSTVQYFPSAEYLARVIAEVARAMRPGGMIFVGDVRNLETAPAFYAQLALERAEPTTPREFVARSAARRAQMDTELVVSPAYFTQLAAELPGVTSVELSLHEGRARNEMSMFRFNAVLTVGGPPREPTAPALDASALDLAGVRAALAAAPPALRLTDLRDQRIADSIALTAALGDPALSFAADARAASRVHGAPAVDPAELCALARGLGYDVVVGPPASGAAGRFDAAIARPPACATLAAVPARPGARLASQPMRAERLDRLQREIRDRLRARLPDFMIPSDVVALDALPLSANGKLDRAALPAISRDDLGSGTLPRSDTERIMAEVWSCVLGLDGEQVRIEHNLFDLGGDSIRSIQIMARLRRRGLLVTATDLFRYPTIAELAVRAQPCPVEGAPAEDARTATPIAWPEHRRAAVARLLADEAIEDVYPATPMQQYMWRLRRLADAPGLYVSHTVTELRAPLLDADALARAWQHIVDLHPVFRTAFAELEPGYPVQIVFRRVALPFERLDWRGLSDDEVRARSDALVRAARAANFALDRAPMRRLALATLDGGRHLLFSFLSYMLQDGWSHSLSEADLFHAYRALTAGERPSVPPRPAFRELVAWLETCDPEPGVRYFRRALAGHVPHPPLITGRTARPLPSGSDPLGQVAAELSVSLTTRLRAFCRRHQLTASTVAQAAWAAVLAAASGRADILFGMVLSGRAAAVPGVEQSFGFFNNILPVRLVLDPATPLGELLRAAQIAFTEIRQHEHTSPDSVRDLLGLAPGQLITDSYIVFENFPVDRAAVAMDAELDIGETTWLAQTEHPIRLEIFPVSRWHVSIAYQRRWFDEAEAQGLLVSFEHAIEVTLTDIDQPAGRILEQLVHRPM